MVNHNAMGFLSKTGPDPLENHKATKAAFKFGPLSARQGTSFKWRLAGGPIMAGLDHLYPHLLK